MSAYLTSEALEHVVGVAQATQQSNHSMSLQFLELQTGVNEILRVVGGRQVLLNNIHNRYSPGERLNQEGEEMESPETAEARKDLRQKVKIAPATMLPDMAQAIYDLLDSSSTFPPERKPTQPAGKGRYNTSIDGTVVKGPFAEGKDSEPRQHQGSSASNENRGKSAQKRGRALGDREETVDARAGAKDEREGPTEKDEERKKSQRTEGPEKGDNQLGPSEDDKPEGMRVERPGEGQRERSREVGEEKEKGDPRAGDKDGEEGRTGGEEKKKSQRKKGQEKESNQIGPTRHSGTLDKGSPCQGGEDSEPNRGEPSTGAGESGGSKEGSDGDSQPPDPHTGQGKEDNQPASPLDELDGDSVPDTAHPMSDEYDPVRDQNAERLGLGLDLHYPESREETPDKMGEDLSEKEDESLPSQIRGATGGSEVIDLRTQQTPMTQGASDNLQSPTPSQVDGTRISGRIRKPTDRFTNKSGTQ